MKPLLLALCTLLLWPAAVVLGQQTITANQEVLAVNPSTLTPNLISVRLQGTVVAALAAQGAFWVHDGVATVAVRPGSHALPTQGDRVEVVGSIMAENLAGKLRPRVLASAVRVLGKAELPEPRPISLTELSNYQHYDQWVSADAWVWLWRLLEGSLDMELRLNAEDRWATARIVVPRSAVPKAVHGAKLQLAGVNAGGHGSYDSLQVPSLAQVKVLAAGKEDPFEMPLTTALAIKAQSPAMGERLRFQGTVAARSGPRALCVVSEGLVFYCNLTRGWDSYAGTAVRGDAGDVPELVPGDVVEVVGTPLLADQEFSTMPFDLTWCHVRATGKREAPPTPKPLPLAAHFQSPQQMDWVVSEGVVTSWGWDGSQLHLLLAEKDALLLCDVRDAQGMTFPKDLFGARVQLTGLMRARQQGGHRNLFVPSPQFMKVLRPGKADPFGSSVQSVASVAAHAVPFGDVIRVKGTFLGQASAERLFVRGKDSAMDVSFAPQWFRDGSFPQTQYADGGPMPKLSVGDEIEIAGIQVHAAATGPTDAADFIALGIRVVGKAANLAPHAAALSAITKERYTSEWVETRGRLMSLHRIPNGKGKWQTLMTLEEDGAEFAAIYEGEKDAVVNLRVDDDLALNAIVERATSSGDRRLRLLSPSAVKSLGVASAVTQRKMWLYGGSSVLVVTALLAWIAALRRSAKRREQVAAQLKAAHDAARESELRWKLLFEQSPLSVQIFAPGGLTKRVNEAWQKLFNLSEEQGLSFNVLEDPALNASGAVNLIRKAFEGEVVHVPPVPYPIPGDPPTERWIGGVLYPVKNDSGQVMEVVTVHNDTTESKRAAEAMQALNQTLEKRVEERTAELRQAEKDLSKALEQERELHELKSRFVSMVSHEFRTPLGVIMSSVEIMRHFDEKLTLAKRKELAEDIHGATRGMADLMEQVLVLGRVEAGKLGFRPGTMDFQGLAAKLVDESLSATNRKCPIRWDIGPGMEAALGDEALLRHIFGNLLSNAVKYSPEGKEVIFSVQREGMNAVCQVIDHGIGIPEKDLPQLFEAFHRGSNVEDIPGTGLGLVIVKRCVDLHGGSITLQTEPGVGTAFTVTLPLWQQ